jgi:hypothetical protein
MKVRAARRHSREQASRNLIREAGGTGWGLAMLAEHVETLVVGGGQAGLAMSDMLSRRARAAWTLQQQRCCLLEEGSSCRSE